MVTTESISPTEAFVELIDALYQLIRSAELKPPGMFTNSVCKRRLITLLIRDPHPDERGLYHLESKDGRYAELVRNDGILLVKAKIDTKTDPIVLPAEIDQTALETNHQGTKPALLPSGDAERDCERVINWLDLEGRTYHDADVELEHWRLLQGRLDKLNAEINELRGGTVTEPDHVLETSDVDKLEQVLQQDIAMLQSQLKT